MLISIVMLSTLVPTRESTDSQHPHVLVFVVQSRRFALPLHRVEKVIPSVAVMPWPQAPNFVAGVVDVHGHVLPVVRAEALLADAQELTPPTEQAIQSHPEAQPGLHHHFIILEYKEMRIVLWVERTLEVTQIQELELKGIPHAAHEAQAQSVEQRWSPIRTDGEITLLWNEARLFDDSQAQFLHHLWNSVGTRPLS